MTTRAPNPKVDIRETEKGVVVDLGRLYFYPEDGHGNITFADGTNWPYFDEIEAIELFGRLLRQMRQQAGRKALRAS